MFTTLGKATMTVETSLNYGRSLHVKEYRTSMFLN